MSFQDFNSRTSGETYSYRRNPVHDHSFLIIKKLEERQKYEPIGDYTVLDPAENVALSEKKVMNLVALLNGRPQDVINLREHVDGTRLHYHRVPKQDHQDKTHIIFYTHGGEGPSVENAVLAIEEEF